MGHPHFKKLTDQVDLWFLFISDSLSGNCKRFSLKETKMLFPLGLNHPSNYHLKDVELPPLQSYLNENDSSKTIEEKTKLYQESLQRGERFTLSTDVVRYCDLDAFLLVQIVTAFMDYSYQLQAKLQLKLENICRQKKITFDTDMSLNIGQKRRLSQRPHSGLYRNEPLPFFHVFLSGPTLGSHGYVSE